MATAVITGGAQGIGRATAERFLERGWRVAVIDRDREAVEALTREVAADGLLALAADAGAEGEVARAFHEIARFRGGDPLKLLFNDAGIADPVTGPVEALPLATFRAHVDAALTAAFLCTRAAVPDLRAARGAIVNMASTRAFQSEPHTEAYAAAKGGVVALTHALAVSLGPAVRVNAVAPGWIDTAPLSKPSARSAPEHDEADHAQHPVGRIGRPQDVADAVAFLASDAAAFLTGETLVLDGGMSRRMIYAD